MKIFVLKFWYAACTIFCLYNLSTLVLERYEVAILASNQSENDPIIFLICTELSSFQINKTEISLEELREQLVNHFNRLKYNPNGLLLSGLKMGQYLIFNGLLCILLKEKNEASYFSGILTRPVFFAFKSSTLDFTQIPIVIADNSEQESLNQAIVQMKGPPYSDCSESNGRFRCLNECFKRSFRLSRYFYEGNETGLIHLKPTTNRTIEEMEKSCFQKCWRENCKIVRLSPFSEGEKKPVTTKLKAHPKLNDFWIQFIGLVCSFANISLNQLASMVTNFACLRVKRRKVRIGLFCVKWAILFLSLTYCGYLYTSMVFDYKTDQRNPPRKEMTRNHIKQKLVRFAICVKIDDYSTLDSVLNFNDLNKTMREIEKITDGALGDYLKSIHLNYQGRLFKVDYIIEPKALFRFFERIQRCFVLAIRPNYQLMHSDPKLTVEFKKDFVAFYLLTEKEDLNEQTFEYTFEFTYKKSIIKRLKIGRKCLDYADKYKNCTNRLHCIQSCIQRESFKKFKRICFNEVVVDKDQFTSKEWNTYPMEIESYFNQEWSKILSEYKDISKKCFEMIPDEPPCHEVKFSKTVEITQPDEQKLEIDLLLDVELSIEELSWFNLLLNIMSIHTIFFSMNVLRLLRVLYNSIKPTLRIRNEKIVQFLIYLLCSIGFTLHTYRILDLTINEELTYNPDYEIANTVRMPVLVFCLTVDEKLIDRNYQQTGHYLDQVTNDMITENLFKSILYLDETNEWTSLNLSLVERFFFLHLKCFRITIHQSYDRRQFHFSTNSQVLKVLKVNFTNEFWSEEGNKIIFMTKTNETAGFSNVLSLFYELYIHYFVDQNEFAVNYEDRFSFIKRFFAISYEDDFNDLHGQFLPDLKSSEFSFRTLKIPIEKEDFDFELQDDLFEQLFAQIKTKATPNLLDSLDYQQKFVFNQLKDVYSDSDFTFSLSLIKKTQSSKNEAKLILGLLNVLFWFDLGILDLYPIFVYFYVYLLVWLPIYLLDKITQFLLFSHRWLKKFEAPLYRRLDSRKQNSGQTPRV